MYIILSDDKQFKKYKIMYRRVVELVHSSEDKGKNI